MRSTRFPAALAALALLAVVACGTATSSAGTSSSGVSRAPTATQQGSGTAAGAPGYITPKDSVNDTVSPPPLPGLGPRIIRNASLTVEVANNKFESTLTRLIDLAARAGGYVSGSNAVSDSSDRIRTGTITFAVPADKYESTISEIRGFGTVQAFNASAQDVSAQYVDVQARLKNAEAQRDAMLLLLQRATSIPDIITIQNQIGQITGQIEQLKGQISYLEHATTYSTINVTLREAAVVAPKTVDELGFQSALRNAVYYFFQSVNFLVVALGVLAPYLLIALLGWGAFTAWRRRRRPAPA